MADHTFIETYNQKFANLIFEITNQIKLFSFQYRTKTNKTKIKYATMIKDLVK